MTINRDSISCLFYIKSISEPSFCFTRTFFIAVIILAKFIFNKINSLLESFIRATWKSINKDKMNKIRELKKEISNLKKYCTSLPKNENEAYMDYAEHINYCEKVLNNLNKENIQLRNYSRSLLDSMFNSSFGRYREIFNEESANFQMYQSYNNQFKPMPLISRNSPSMGAQGMRMSQNIPGGRHGMNSMPQDMPFGGRQGMGMSQDNPFGGRQNMGISQNAPFGGRQGGMGMPQDAPFGRRWGMNMPQDTPFGGRQNMSMSSSSNMLNAMQGPYQQQNYNQEEESDTLTMTLKRDLGESTQSTQQN